jgi:pimeloyl-ACP methyl ester carboxylesterase
VDIPVLVDRSPAVRDRSPQAVAELSLEIDRAGARLTVPVHASRALVADPGVRRLVIVIQGDRRRPIEYLGGVQDAAAASEVDDALILAPHFRVAEELAHDEQQTDAAYWSASGWKEGGLTRDVPWPRAWRVSSFTVADALIAAVIGTGLWPGIEEVVLVGHSAGGQFVQRYAAGTRIDQSLAASGLAYRFVVANPSSYLYLTADRLSAATGAFAELTPEQIAACPQADRYKYGLHGRNAYMAESTRASTVRRYAARSIDYVVGELDTDPDDERFDRSCAASLQGATRRARAAIFHRYLAHAFGTAIHARHRLVVVPGVGHDVRGIIANSAVRDLVFGRAREPAGA